MANPTGSEAFPASEPEFGTVDVVARGNYSPVEIRDYLVEVEQQILQVQGIQDVIMSFGGGDGMMSGATPPDTIGSFQLQLHALERPRQGRRDLHQHPRAGEGHPGPRRPDHGAGERSAGRQGDQPPRRGHQLRRRRRRPSASCATTSQNELGDTVDVEDGRPAPGIDWEITIDRVEAAKYGIGVRELAPYVQLVTSGVKLGSYRPDDATDELDIRVRLPEDERTLDILDSLRIVTAQGLVPVANFIKRTPVPKVANLSRRNGIYSMNVAANLLPGVAADVKIEELQAWEADADLAVDRDGRLRRRRGADRRHQRLHRAARSARRCSSSSWCCCSSTTASTR